MKPVRFSKEWLLANFWMKTLSVFLATSLWYLVNFTGSSEVAVEATLRFTGIPERYEMLWQSNRSVTVWLSGQRRAIRLIDPETVVATVDLSHAKSGESFHQLGFADLTLPPGVQPTKISPNVIRVHLEQIITKRLKVRPVFEGEPREGYRIARVDVVPSTVRVRGPRRFLRGEKEIRTAPVDLGGISGTMSYAARLETDGTSLKADIEGVTVTVMVEPVETGPGPENKDEKKDREVTK